MPNRHTCAHGAHVAQNFHAFVELTVYISGIFARIVLATFLEGHAKGKFAWDFSPPARDNAIQLQTVWVYVRV